MKRIVLLALLTCLLAGGCLTRSIEETVFEQEGTTVMLRSQRKSGETLPKGYQHPAVISGARLAHILSRIDVSGDGDKSPRQPAIPLENLYVISDGMKQALAKANPDQEIVVMSIRRGKHWGIFDRRYLTSLIAFLRDDLLYVHVSRVDWEIPASRDTELPEPYLDEQVMPFRLVASEGMTLVDAQALAVRWRDPIFKRPTRTRILPSGRVVRREILMESPDEAPAAPLPAGSLPANLSPDTLRKLADLEDEKQNGEVTQNQYNILREAILRADPSFSEPQ